jgi:hypothetical protein
MADLLPISERLYDLSILLVFRFDDTYEHDVLLNHHIPVEEGRMPNKINGTGIMLPINPNTVECRGDKPNAIPTGIAPLNSITGSMDMTRTIDSGPKPSSIVFNQSTISLLL